MTKKKKADDITTIELYEQIQCLTDLPFEEKRRAIRKQLADLFMAERPGTGKGDLTSKYHYNVERTAQGNIIYIKRPAHLNKGFDFTVHVDEIYFPGKSKRTRRPGHIHITSALMKASDNMRAHVLKCIDDIYHCNACDYSSLDGIFLGDYSAELIVKCSKWLFIEQDITYWNSSGRAMLYTEIKKVFPNA